MSMAGQVLYEWVTLPSNNYGFLKVDYLGPGYPDFPRIKAGKDKLPCQQQSHRKCLFWVSRVIVGQANTNIEMLGNINFDLTS